MTQSTIDSEVEARILTFMSDNLHIILEDEGDQSEIPRSKFAKDLAAQLANTIAQEANKAVEAELDKCIATVKRNPEKALDILWGRKAQLTEKGRQHDQ